MQFATLSGKYLPTKNIQVVISFESSEIPKCVNPKNYNLLIVSRGNLKGLIRSSCEKNRFVCQDVSVLLSNFVRLGNGLTVWNTRMSGLHTHTHSDRVVSTHTHCDIVWSAYLRERSQWKYKYKYNEDRKTTGRQMERDRYGMERGRITSCTWNRDLVILLLNKHKRKCRTKLMLRRPFITKYFETQLYYIWIKGS